MANETDIKIERLIRVARDAGVAGIVLNTQRNFAWLTGGAVNRIDGSRETGAGSLLIGKDGRRFAIANAIEMPRLQNDSLPGLGFEPVEYAWTDDHANPAIVSELATRVLSTTERIGADWPLPNMVVVEGAITRVRAPLTDEEVTRYRALGADCGRALGALCRTLKPGASELEVAGQVAAAIALAGARAVVVLVAADDRISRYRHPVPTAARWKQTLLIGLCAERAGLVVSLSRIVAAGQPAAALVDRTRATASVFDHLLSNTRAGAAGADLYATAARAYSDAGFPGEEHRHHQGGATGYRTREWIAHPRSAETVLDRQAFAWNPTITGSKVEETVLVIDGHLETLTTSPDWPVIPLTVSGGRLQAPDVLRL